MTAHSIEVPPGLNGVAVADTAIGDVLGDEGFYHYRGLDATALARTHTFEEVWYLLHEGRLPSADEAEEFTRLIASLRFVPDELVPIVDAAAAAGGEPLAQLRTVLSLGATVLGLRPLIDLDHDARRAQSLQLAAIVPSVLAALHRRSRGLAIVAPDPTLGHAASYLYETTGERPDPVAVRAVEQYLLLTIDHGFNASTFTARVVASTGADLADCVCAALGALAGPLHGGAPGRALDALDAIGSPDRAAEWVRAEVAAGRRIMGFGHAVYRSVDPRSVLLRAIAEELGQGTGWRTGRAGDRGRGRDPRHARRAEAGPGAAEQRRVLRRRRHGIGRRPPRDVHADVRRQPHRRLVHPRRRAGRGRQADPPGSELHRSRTPPRLTRPLQE